MSKFGAVVTALVAAALCVGCGAGRQNHLAAAPLSHPAQSRPWTFAGVRGQRLNTGHYLLFTTVDNPVLKGGIAGFMEAARANYVDLTGLAEAAVDEKMKVYLFATRGEWALLTEKVTGAASETALKVQAGGYCYGGICVFWDIGVLPTFSTAAHEGMHQFLYHITKQGLPGWAEEGLAVGAEGFRISDGLVSFRPGGNNLRMTTLRKAILGGRWRPVDRLIGMSASRNINQSGRHAADYYSQLWALLLLIRSDPVYSDGLKRMCRDAATGNLGQALGYAPGPWAKLERNGQAYEALVGPKAFFHYIDADTERFEQRYLAFARQLAKLD